jgi:transposase InsO family protein
LKGVCGYALDGVGAQKLRFLAETRGSGGIGRAVHVPDPLVGTRSSAAAFDGVFAGIGARVIRVPVRAPRANAFVERFVGTVRREWLDHLLVINEAHLRAVLADMARQCNQHCPHQGRRQQAPNDMLGVASWTSAAIQRR